MILSPQDVLYFHSIAETENLRAAAERLHVTQPALSHSLKRLEEAAGGSLFERTSKGLKLTSLGRRFLSESRAALDVWSKLSSVSEENPVPRRLKIGMHPSVATYFVSDFLKEIRKIYQNLGLDLIHGLSRDLTRMVIEGELDAAVAINPVRSPGLVIRELMTDTVALVGLRSNITSDHIIYDPALAQSQWLLKALDKKGVHFTSETHSGNLEVIRSLAESGLGVAILPLRVAALARVKLQVVGTDGPIYRDRLCFVCRPHFPKNTLGGDVLQAAKTVAQTSSQI